MSEPRVLKVPLEEFGYYMELDTRKSDCNQEAPHWHLCKRGRRIGQISYDGYWTDYPSTDTSRSIIKEAEDKTRENSSYIYDFYLHNKKFGSDY